MECKDIQCTVSIVDKVSNKTGNPYKAIVLKIKGKEVQVGILDVYKKLDFVRLGYNVD